MTLSDAQIERYSRQIIVPGFGGRAQERLLAARLALVGEAADLALALAYLVGAGVGAIEAAAPGASPAWEQSLASRMRALNPEVQVRFAASPPADCDLMAALIGSEAARGIAERTNRTRTSGPTICARLDEPASILIAPVRPPCLACAGQLAAFGPRAGRAAPIALLAVAEMLKLLAGQPPPGAATLITFDQYASATRALSPDPNCPVCAAGRALC